MVLQKLKVILLNVVALFRRALCCFTRRHKHGTADQLQPISIIVEPRDKQIMPATQKIPERDWNSWDDSPRTVDEHIEQYRQRIAQPPTPPKDEPEPDFFSDLTPVIKPQLKYYLEDDNSAASQISNFSRLKAQTDVPIALNADLEDWVDDNAGEWEELDNENTKQLFREKLREMRNQKRQQQQQQKASATAEQNKLLILKQQQKFKNQLNINNGIDDIKQHGIGITTEQPEEYRT